jgi:hypothetical protein
MHRRGARLLVCLWSLTLALATARSSIASLPEAGLKVAASDPGTAATMVRNIYQTIDATPGSFPRNFTVMGDTAYFVATDSSNGRELWRTDGSPDGTTRSLISRQVRKAHSPTLVTPRLS